MFACFSYYLFSACQLFPAVSAFNSNSKIVVSGGKTPLLPGYEGAHNNLFCFFFVIFIILETVFFVLLLLSSIVSNCVLTCISLQFPIIGLV